MKEYLDYWLTKETVALLQKNFKTSHHFIYVRFSFSLGGIKQN